MLLQVIFKGGMFSGVTNLIILLIFDVFNFAYLYNCLCAAPGEAWKGPTKVSPEAPNFLVDKGDCLHVFMTPQARELF